MSLNGYVDVLKETEISGWAVDKSNLAQQVSVEIHINAVPVVVVRCCVFRDDLLNAGLGDGRKAFHFNPGRYLSAGTNTVEICYAGTRVPLTNGSGKLLGVSRSNIQNPGASDLNRLLELSQQRWKGSENDAGLTWGEIFTGDSFVDALHSHLKFDGSQHICEIGPGYGRLLTTIRERQLPFRKYTGIELSQERVRALKAKFAMESVEFIQGDVNTVRLPEKADLVICSATFEHLFPDFTVALTNIVAQNVNPLAKLAIDFIQSDDTMAHQWQGFEPDGHAFVRIYSSDELRRLYTGCGVSITKLDSIVLGQCSSGEIKRILVFSQIGASIDPGGDQATPPLCVPDLTGLSATGGPDEHRIKTTSTVNAPSGVDVDWYLRTYPQVASQLERGLTPEEHYHQIGRYRGYLPRTGAQRLEWPDRPQSRFGGLWTDQANALDLVDGKLDLGMINAQQADTLREWIRDGYVILKGALPSRMVEGARAELDKAYGGGFPDVIFDCVHRSPQFSPFRSYHRHFPTKALDLHWKSQATRDAIFAPTILEFLYLVFQRRPMATQSLGFLRGSAQGAHQDAAYVSYTNYMQFTASWIALEDVTPGAGELFYYPGSQKLPDYLYPGENKNTIDAQRWNPQIDLSGHMAEHVNMLPHRCSGAGIEQQRFMAKAGDVLIWSADLVHGGSPISSEATRKSIVTHYCPKELAPLYFEDKPREIHFHESGNPYTTYVY